MQNFDATNIPPQQVAGKHPEGNFPFQLTNAFGQENKNKDGAMLVVEFTSPAGSILNYYNLFNKNQQATEIAQKELSALCHAVGVFKLSMADAQGNPLAMNMWAQELKGARGTMKVRKQANSDFMEIEKVFDSNGNEPGKSGAAAAPQTQQAGNGVWGATQQPQSQNNAPAANSGGGWGNGQQAPATQQPPQQGWQPGPSNQAPIQQQQPQGQGANPPWAR